MNEFQSNRIVNEFQSNQIWKWISVKPDLEYFRCTVTEKFQSNGFKKVRVVQSLCTSIHKMLHDDLRDSENRFLEFFWTWTFEIVRSRSSNNVKFSNFEHFHCNWTVRYNLKRVSKIGSDIFLFRSFHFSFYNYKYCHSQTESERLVGTTITVRFRILLKPIVTPNWRLKMISLSVRFDIETSH